VPELPEVETVRRNLAESIGGAQIVAVIPGTFTGCIDAIEPEQFCLEVSGSRILDIGRRAKYLLIHLDSDDTIAIHLRMTGKLSVDEPATPLARHHHLTFTLDDGRELRFADTRKFGRIRLLSPDQLAALDTTLGPEPFDPALTPERFHAMLAARTRAIKPLLLDQQFIAGVGNIYADEALFAAKIHPLRAANSLSPDEAAKLLAAIRSSMSGAIGRGGSTIRDYRDGFGQTGTNQRYLRIYTLAEGDPCPDCGTAITRTVVGQRGTRFCPTCQPAPTPDMPGRSHPADPARSVRGLDIPR
jgi:formamidopyrimidine-DNA glycosylase